MMQNVKPFGARFSGHVTAARPVSFFRADAFLEEKRRLPEETPMTFHFHWRLTAELKLFDDGGEYEWPSDEILGPFASGRAVSGIHIDIRVDDPTDYIDGQVPTYQYYKDSGKIPSLGWFRASRDLTIDNHTVNLTLPAGSDLALRSTFVQLPISIDLHSSHFGSGGIKFFELELGQR